MFAWRAVYEIRSKETGTIKRMEYYVAAPTAGDVPTVIRDVVNLENAEVMDVEIRRLRASQVISDRELKDESPLILRGS